MELFTVSLFICCLAEALSSPYNAVFGFHPQGLGLYRYLFPKNDPWKGTTSKSAIPTTEEPEGTTPKPVIPVSANPEVYLTFEDKLADLQCTKGKIAYAIEAYRNCNSYLKCESGNLPARIRCPPRQVFSQDTLNCEEDGLCDGMTLEERENLYEPMARKIYEGKSILEDDQHMKKFLITNFKLSDGTFLNFLEDFLKLLSCVTDIKTNYNSCYIFERSRFVKA